MSAKRPIASLATAIPPTATLSVAIHVLHMLPHTVGELDEQLIATAERMPPMRFTTATVRSNSTALTTATAPTNGSQSSTTRPHCSKPRA